MCHLNLLQIYLIVVFFEFCLFLIIESVVLTDVEKQFINSLQIPIMKIPTDINYSNIITQYHIDYERFDKLYNKSLIYESLVNLTLFVKKEKIYSGGMVIKRNGKCYGFMPSYMYQNGKETYIYYKNNPIPIVQKVTPLQYGYHLFISHAVY